MKALLLKDTHRFEMIDMDKPIPGPGEALVRVLSAAICGSEIHGYHGKHFGRKAPAVMGHEVCGIVTAFGPDTVGPELGSRVVVMPQRSCGTCRWCREGSPNLCTSRIMLGFTKWPGAYAEYFVIPAHLLYPIPDSFTAQQATLIEPFAVGIHGIRRAGIKLGDSVMVIGSGAVGLLSILAAKAAGATTIIATDILDYNLAHAQRLGATHVYNSATETRPIADMARDLTGGFGPDHAVLAVAAPGLLEESIRAVRNHGSICIIASYTEPVLLDIQASQLKEQTILGSVTYDQEDFRIATALAAGYQPLLADLITHEFRLEQAKEAFELVAKRAENLVRVVFTL